jgi:predicted DNA-binding transcriptional regulator YafY
MSLTKYIRRIMRINALICQKATGTPEEFASKLGIHRSTLFQSLQEMREMGVDIRYSDVQQSYYYADDRRIIINIEGFLSGKTILEEIN